MTIESREIRRGKHEDEWRSVGRRWRRRLPWIIFSVALVVVAVRGTFIILDNSESFFNNDEPRQIMTSIFWYDFFRIRPLSDPVGFAQTYYSRYPAIGVLHWPPLLHLTTSLVFLGTGPSVMAARFVILFATLAFYVIIFILVRDTIGLWPAVMGVLLLGSVKLIQPFQTVFMLEIPCMLLMTLAVLTLMKYVSTSTHRHIWYCAASVMFAVLTKQHGIIIVPVILGIGILNFKRSHWKDIHLYVSFTLAGLLSLAYYLFTLLTISSSWADITQASGDSFRYLWLFAKKVGPVLIMLSLGGMVTTILGGTRNGFLVGMVLWIGCTFLLFFSMGVKVDRYLIYAVPPMVILGAEFLSLLIRYIPRKLPGVLLAFLGFAFVWTVWHTRTLKLSGYEQAALWAKRSSEAPMVIFGGRRDATFILYRRLHDPQLRTITLRADKLVGWGKGIPTRDYTRLVTSREELQALMATLGHGAVILEDVVDYDKPEHHWFWEIVADQYTLQTIIPVHDPFGRVSELRGYRTMVDSGDFTRIKIPVQTREGYIYFDPNITLYDY